MSDKPHTECTPGDRIANMVAELRATRAELSDALNVLAQIEQAVGGKVPMGRASWGWRCKD